MASEDIHKKLMSKVSSQAALLGRSAEYIEICEGKIRDLEKNKQEYSKQDDAARLLTVSESLCAKLQQDVFTKERQCKLNERKILELGREIQKIKVQSETTQHALRFTQPLSNVSASQSKVVSGLRSEIDALKAHLNSYQNQLESSKRNEQVTILKLSALEETLEKQSQYICAPEQADLLAKLSDQQKVIKKLKSKLEKKRKEMAIAAAPLLRIFSPVSKNSIENQNRAFVGNSFSSEDSVNCVSSLSSHEEKVVALEHIIVSGQQKLSLVEKELQRTQTGEITANLKAIEAERDVLLEFIQSDMKKSSEVNFQLEKVQLELEDCLTALQIQEDRGVHIESSYHNALARSSNLVEQLTASQKQIETMNEDYQSDKAEKNEEAKKGTYIISVLTSELKLARIRVQEVEQVQKNLEKYNETLKTLLKTAKMDVSKPIPSSSPTILEAVPSTSTKEYDAHHSEELIFLRRERENSLYERSVLQRELNDLRPLDQALAQLISDLKSPLNQLEPISSIYSNDDEEPSVPPPPHVHTKSSLEETGGYSDMYSKASNRDSSIPNYMRGRSSISSHGPLRSSYDDERGRGKVTSPTRSLNTSATPLPTGQRTSSSISQRLRHQACPLSERNSNWIALPSIPRLSVSLHEKIKSLAADLMFSESKYWRLEVKFQDTKKSLEKINAINANKVLELIASIKVMENFAEELRGLLHLKDAELEEHKRSTDVLDLTATALNAIPGGWRQYSDYHHNSSEGKKRYESPPPFDRTLDKDNVTRWQDVTTIQNDEHSSPGPRKPLSASKRYAPLAASRNLIDIDAKGGGRIPYHLIPKVMAQVVVALQKASSTENSTLNNALSALRISKGEHEYLFNQMENARLQSENRNDAFVLIESNLRRDLESALSLTEKQNSLSKNLESKLDILVREKCLMSAQLTTVNHQNEGVKQQFCNLLRDHAKQTGFDHDPQKLPPFLSINSDPLSVDMGELIRYAEEMLSIRQPPKHPHRAPNGGKQQSVHAGISTDLSSLKATSSAGNRMCELGEREGGLLPMTPMTPDSEKGSSDERKEGHNLYCNDNIDYDYTSNIYDTSKSATSLRGRRPFVVDNSMHKSRNRIKESINRIGSRSIESNNIASISPSLAKVNNLESSEGRSSNKGRGVLKGFTTTDRPTSDKSLDIALSNSDDSPNTQLRARVMKAQSSFAAFRENISAGLE